MIQNGSLFAYYSLAETDASPHSTSNTEEIVILPRFGIIVHAINATVHDRIQSGKVYVVNNLHRQDFFDVEFWVVTASSDEIRSLNSSLSYFPVSIVPTCWDFEA